MPETLRKNGYVVCVYCERGVQHHLPHCHIKWGDKEAVVALPTLKLIVGDRVPAAGIAILVDNISVLVEHWERLNRCGEPRTGKRVTKADKRVQK